MRSTSLEAYREIKEKGLLSERRFQVYEVLYLYGPLTTGEIWKFYFSENTRIPQNSINPRLSELEKIGVVKAVGMRKCTVTGYNCTLWDATDSLPQKPAKHDRIKCAYCQGKGYVEQGVLF